MRSQEDMFISLITKRVLDQTVSLVLTEAFQQVHKEENKVFNKALKFMSTKQLSFWVAPSDSQFWLDQHRYDMYQMYKKELSKVQ